MQQISSEVGKCICLSCLDKHAVGIGVAVCLAKPVNSFICALTTENPHFHASSLMTAAGK